MQQLAKDGAVSRQQLDAAVLQRDVARTHLDAAQAARQLAQVHLDHASIRAPFDGRVAEIPVAVGEYIAPGAKIAVLYDDRTLEVETHVGERDLALVRAGQMVTVTSPAAPSAAMAGTVRLIIPAADPASRVATLRIRLVDPPPTVLPGTSATAQIVVERRENVLVVPTQALRHDGSDAVVVVKDGRADVRQVRVGLRHHPLSQIIDGVSLGEVVVTLGPESLSDGQAVKVVNR
jgi:RND family efflux transporter MFP subunit